jgi:hypothetical protein
VDKCKFISDPAVCDPCRNIGCARRNVSDEYDKCLNFMDRTAEVCQPCRTVDCPYRIEKVRT